MKKRILFISNIVSPFQYDVADVINNSEDFAYYQMYVLGRTPIRRKHWFQDPRGDSDQVFLPEKNQFPSDDLLAWCFSVLDAVRPDVVIINTFANPCLKPIIQELIKRGIPHGFWLEPPTLTRNGILLEAYVRVVVRYRMRSAAFVFGIGDRAVEWYRKAFSGPIELIPYGQDLTEATNRGSAMKADRGSSDVLTLLYSGQLIVRQNPAVLAESLVILFQKHAGAFRFILAAHGELEDEFWEIIDRQPGLRALITVDTEYATWEDRLRPFAMADVLVYPSRHSGWGLVIPEAMAAGCIPVVTTNVEAARYFVEEGVNGFFVRPDAHEIAEKLGWIIEHRAALPDWRASAQVASEKGSHLAVGNAIMAHLRQRNFS